jgi:hypothetical protein
LANHGAIDCHSARPPVDRGILSAITAANVLTLVAAMTLRAE